MLSRLLPAILLALTACQSASEGAPPKAAIQLTHQWSVPPGVSVFTQNNLGTDPPQAADTLMPAPMPNVVYQLGEKCQTDPAFATEGSLTIEALLTGSTPTQLTILPPSTGADCVRSVFAEVLAAQEGLDSTTPAKIHLHLKHSPLTP